MLLAMTVYRKNMFNNLSQVLLPIIGILIGLAIAVLLFWMIIRAIIQALKGIFAAVCEIPFALGTVFLFLKQYPSVIGIVAVNLIPLAGVIWYDWKPFAVIFTYWVQTGIIGFFSLLKIKKVAEFSEPEQKIRVIAFQVSRRGPARPVSQIIKDYIGVYFFGMAVSFLILMFYNGYAEADTFNLNVFINSFYLLYSSLLESAGVIAFGSLSFFLNHGYSYFFNFIGKKEFLQSDLALEFEAPIERVGTIWAAVFLTVTTLGFIPHLAAVLVMFVVMKTMFDVYAHLKEHGRYFYWQYEYKRNNG